MTTDRTLADFFRDNPSDVAGMANVPDTGSSDVLQACTRFAADMLECDAIQPKGFLDDESLARVMFVLLRIAQLDYDDGTFWPFVANRLGIPVHQKCQDRFGEWFRKGLTRFHYQVFPDDQGQSNLTPILMHTVPRKSLRGLLQLIVKRIEVCGPEPNPDELRDVVEAWTEPGLHKNLRRLLSSGWQGAIEIWSSLAEVVLVWPDAARVEDALSWLPSIIDKEMVREILQELNQPCGTLQASTWHPQIRYDSRDGSVHLWIPDGTPEEWTVLPKTKICWDPLESGWVGEFWDPIPDELTFTRKDNSSSTRVVATTFSSANCPATLWFRGSDGILLPSDRVRNYGIEEGRWYLVCHAEPEPTFPAQTRRPLNPNWAGWSAWEVDVSADESQSKTEDPTWKFPPSRPTMSVRLALRPGPRIQFVCRADPTQEVQPIVASAMLRHEQIPVYAAMPSVVLRRRRNCKLLVRRWNGSRFVAVRQETLMPDIPVTLDNQPGIFQFREAGSLRSVHQFAVIPEFATDGPTYLPDGERVEIRLHADANAGDFVPVGDATNTTSVEQRSPTEWRLHASTVQTVASVGWRWRGDDQSAVDLLLEWPLSGLRWRIKRTDEQATRWTRDLLSLDEQNQNAQLEIQVPPEGELLINDEPVRTMQPCSAGRYLRRPLAAYSQCIRLTYQNRRFDAVVFVRRPTLDVLLADSEADQLVVRWAGDCPDGTDLMIWDPLHPQQPPITVPLGSTIQVQAREERYLPWSSIPITFAPLVAVTLVKAECGLGVPRYEAAVRRLAPTTPFGVICRRPGVSVDDTTEALAQTALSWELELLIDRFDDDVIKALRKNLVDIECNHGQVPWDCVGELARQLATKNGLLGRMTSARRERVSNALRELANTRLDWLPILRGLGNDRTSPAAKRFLECMNDGIHLGWIKPHRLVALDPSILTQLPCPLAYYRSVWLLRTNHEEASKLVDSEAIASFAQYRQMQREAANTIWEFHREYGLPSLEKTSPWRRQEGYVPMTDRDEQRLRFTPTSDRGDWTLERFQEELGIDTIFQDAVYGPPACQQKYSLTWEGRKGCGWTIERPTEHAHLPHCKPGLKPIIVDRWHAEDILEILNLRDLLIRWGQQSTARSTVPPLDTLKEVDTALKADSITKVIHKKLLEPASLVKRDLWGESIQRPEYLNVPEVPLMAWRLAWLDRLTVWRGQDYLLAPNGPTTLTPAAFQETLVAAMRAWPRLMTQCLALAEFLYAVLALGGLGMAAKFETPREG